jgi:hypothetical protein
MNCNICHHPNDEDNSYCENCGIKLLPSVAGETWRAKDIVSFFADAIYLPLNFIKALAFISVVCGFCYFVAIYLLHFPAHYLFILILAYVWLILTHYKNTNKILKSLSLIDRNKKVIAHGPSTLLGPAASIGGWLYLMDDGLIFTPESYFINSQVVAIPFSRVRSQSAELGFSIKGDQFQIITTEGQEFIFSVYKREMWSHMIDHALSNLIQGFKA